MKNTGDYSMKCLKPMISPETLLNELSCVVKFLLMAFCSASLPCSFSYILYITKSIVQLSNFNKFHHS